MAGACEHGQTELHASEGKVQQNQVLESQAGKDEKSQNSKKADEYRQPGTKVESEGKSVIPHTKRKTNSTELSQEPFQKLRNCRGMQLLASVKVSHSLGKKSNQKPGHSSSRVLGNSSPKAASHSLLTKQNQKP